MAATPMTPYPVQFGIADPDRALNGLTTFIRVFTAIPIAIILGALTYRAERYHIGVWSYLYAATGLLVVATALMILFRQKYPRWWFDWDLALTRFSYRVTAHLALLRDEYPSTDEEQAVRFTVPYPNAKTELNRWLRLIKWFLAIPHYVIVFVLGIAAFVAVMIAWVAILLTGRYPRPLFDFVVGVLRWSARVAAYAFMLATDDYPPFQLND